ncbi:CBS domain-containing protein [Tenacibaculum sp. MAR_2009_124]|uniref:CBS domain-containing protein n=1 Tax=Tenacibaculum sp. MAR_2009_124 TaxID=1250059 RepID=UPI000897EFE5|nr:CBS domain-containing protein [Tenacibaculum sp. MAR_2009_124]SEC01356.1 CBS domain-containing protein [Tenacibaculum sp. MAR_2009_124]
MGIINFQGKRTAVQKNNSELILVSDYMTKKVVSFKEEQPIEEVIETLINNRISGGPVVNEKNELIGIISEGDCMKQVSESRYYNLPIDKNNTVGKAMVREVETIDGNMNIFDAANKFLESKRRRFPIVENGKLVGQISQKDVLKAAIRLKGNTWK